MRIHWLAPLLFAAPAFAQTGELTVGGSVTASYVVAADEAAFDLEVGAPRLIDTAQVIRAFADLGVKEENIARISTAAGGFAALLLPVPVQQQPQVIWLLRLRVPAAKFKETLDRLDNLSRRLPDPFTSISYTGGLSYSDKALEDATVAAIGRLVEQARRNTQPLARLAGLTAAPLVTFAENTRGADFGFLLSGGLRTSLLPVISTVTARFGRTPERTLSTFCTAEIPLTADQVLFRVDLQAAATTPRAEVIEVAARFGLAARDLTDIRWNLPAGGSFVLPAPGGPPITMLVPSISYRFETRQPAAQAADAFERLAGLRRAPPAPLTGVSYGFGMNVTDAAVDRAYAKAAADSFAACRARAQRIAAAAGVKLGAPRSVAPLTAIPGLAGIIASPGASLSLPVDSNLRAPFSISAVFALE